MLKILFSIYPSFLAYVYEPSKVDRPKQYFLELQWLIDSTIIELQAPQANLSRFTYTLIVISFDFLFIKNNIFYLEFK